MEFNLVQSRKENCLHDHVPFNMKGNGIQVFSVYPRAMRGFFLSVFPVQDNEEPSYIFADISISDVDSLFQGPFAICTQARCAGIRGEFASYKQHGARL